MSEPEPITAGPPSIDGWDLEPAGDYVVAPPRRRQPRVVGALVALAVVAGGFGVVTLTAADGAESPEAAVRAMFDAIDHEDVIGVIEALDPVERDILRPAVEATAREAERVDAASPELDLRKVEGVDLTVGGLELTTTSLGDGYTAVDITQGWVDSAADLDRLPVGATIREMLDEDKANGGKSRPEGDRIDLAGTRLVAIANDGWHVSALYSIAEEIRMSSEPLRSVPTYGRGIPARGASSPEAAVREGLAAAVELDIGRLIELAPPREMAVLHDYGPLLVDAAADARDDHYVAPVVEELELEVADGPDGTKIVSASKYRITAEDSDGTSTWSYDGKCSTIAYEWSDEYLEEYGYDGEDIGPGSSDEPFEVCDDDLDTRGTPFGGLFGLWAPGGQYRIVTEQHDGAWYVSPTRSVIESAMESFRDLTSDDVRDIAGMWRGEWWRMEPDGFWEACKLERPRSGATAEAGNAAWEKCLDALPDDYAGPYGRRGGSVAYDDEAVSDEGPSVDLIGPCMDLPDAAARATCLRPHVDDGTLPAEMLAMVCYDEGTTEAEADACLAELVASGALPAETLAIHRCEAVYDDLPDDASEKEWEAAERAYDACAKEASPGKEPPTTVRPPEFGTTATTMPVQDAGPP
jgi:hypothetical protein